MTAEHDQRQKCQDYISGTSAEPEKQDRMNMKHGKMKLPSLSLAYGLQDETDC